ncbi:MAG: DUF2793 domain-containing protein [Hyphomonas sp.]|uniref:DUF2793 domain-containing protein n=1 Tax=Hyphomonas sp. TaxID=87 RepID=UPI0030034F05
MDSTPRLALPYLLPNQAQKHVTVNEGLHALDVMTGLSVQSRTVSVEPASPVAGHAYILPASPSGAEWSAFEEASIAAYSDGAWLTLVPPEGTRAWVEDELTLYVFTSSAWMPLPIGAVTQLGINTSASTANRLAVKSDTVVFSHDDVSPGSGHIRHTINRASPAHTGSVLFQTDFDGGAELGLAGSDDFEVKVSPDGASWTSGLKIAADDGRISFPAGFADVEAVLQSLGLRIPLGIISDNSIGTADFGKLIYGAIILAIPNALTLAPMACFFARMATSPDLTTVSSAGAPFTVRTVELFGTTGDDGKVNFAATSDGRFIVENRRGYDVAYTLYAFVR